MYLVTDKRWLSEIILYTDKRHVFIATLSISKSNKWRNTNKNELK